MTTEPTTVEALLALGYKLVPIGANDSTTANRDGICGNEAPSLKVGCTSMPVICELRYGHASEWHQGIDGSRWRALPGVDARRDAVVEAARAWRAMRQDMPTRPKPESAALITAVDALMQLDIRHD